MRWMPLMLPLLTGCVAAARGTYHIAQAEQAYALAQQAEASEYAVYAWTMAEAYMLKAREEYALADYQAAEQLAAQAAEWSAKARDIAARRGVMPENPLDVVPESVQRVEEADPLFDNTEEEDVEFELEEGGE